MFLTYELMFSTKIPNFQAIRYNKQEISLLIKYIKESINKGSPVIQSLEIFHPIWKKAAHAVVLIGYNRKSMIYLDPGDGRCKLEKIRNYQNFLAGHRDILVIKRKL